MIIPTGISSTYFSLWTDKDEDIGNYSNEPASNIYDDIINDTSVANSFGVDSNSQEVALVINLNSSISVLDIQSLILYNRISSEARKKRANGLGIELYNRSNDPNLESPLSSTNEITTAEDVYRYDFPAIGTYPSGDFLIRIPYPKLRVKPLL